MTQWEMVLAIVVLIGLVASIVKPIVSLTKSITTLTNSMEGMRLDLQDLTIKNSDSHRRLWEHNCDQDEKINDHETRIQIIERK